MSDATIGVVIKGQKYRWIGSEPYTRKDGASSNLNLWETDCPDCGKPWRITSGQYLGTPNKRCPECAKPGVPVRDGMNPKDTTR